jgi:transposase
MLNITGGLKVFLAVEPADMRKSFNGLYALAVEKLKEDPRQGAGSSALDSSADRN